MIATILLVLFTDFSKEFAISYRGAYFDIEEVLVRRVSIGTDFDEITLARASCEIMIM